jgi:single-stranded DNA-binding protein
VGPHPLSFAVNLVSFSACLWSQPFSIVGRYRYATSGTPYASFTLVVVEQGQDGKAFQTLIDCQVWGKHAEAAGELEAGQLVLFEGKLAKRKKGEQWELCVSGFELVPITALQPTLTGRSN